MNDTENKDSNRHEDKEKGRGNYTEDRKELFKDMTIDDLFEELEKFQQNEKGM